MSDLRAAEDAMLVKVERIMPASPEEVFEAWTDAALVEQWMAPDVRTVASARLDVRVGGEFRVVLDGPDGQSVLSGRYQVVDPPHRLAFTFIAAGTRGKETLVTVDIESQGRQSKVTVTHQGLPDREAADAHSRGWGSVLEKLELHLAGS